MSPSETYFKRSLFASTFLLIIMGLSITIPLANAGDIKSMSHGKSEVMKHWSKERMSNATPRDLFIDERGMGYMRKHDGSFVPYGHKDVTESPLPLGKPSGSVDNISPTITDMDPARGSTISDAHTFSAIVSDSSGVKSVSFLISNGQIFNANNASGDTWTVDLSGFTDGNWSWQVQAKDGAAKGGNTGTSDEVDFTVNTGWTEPPPLSDSDTIINGSWIYGGEVQTAAGRIYFEMSEDVRVRGKWTTIWSAYVCSGTVVDDNTADRSVILTAAHCVYDDVNKAFARNVMFIPNQDETIGSGTDTDCYNDPLGCWTPSFGVVDVNWTTDTFPANKKWDYAYYVVDDSNAHNDGYTPDILDALDKAASTLPISFIAPEINDGTAGASTLDFTHALGYSYSDDPNFMYCAEDMTTIEADNWWLPSCELSGGASGGPWVQPMIDGSGEVISVNSWGYTTAPGMAGPMLNDSSAECLFEDAIYIDLDTVSKSDGYSGSIVDCL